MTNHSPDSKQTPLHKLHRQSQARFVPFSGWEMPVQYQGVVAEHQAIRQAVGMFDISHMGKFSLRGTGLRHLLNRLVPTDLTSLQTGQSQYTVLLNAAAGILDDIILYDEGLDPADPSQECWTVIVNAATCAQDWDWLRVYLHGIHCQDLTDQLLLLAIQGPQALKALQPYVNGELNQLKRFQHGRFSLAGAGGETVFIARTGYTGEDGFEIMLSPEAGEWLWRQALAAGIPPCGLGCRDSLRLEAAMHLYGQDMDSMTTPLEAGLGWLVSWNKTDFIGRDMLMQQKAQGIRRQLVGLQMVGREIARHGYPIYHQGQEVGVVTSGTKSPTLGVAVAMGYIPSELAQVGSSVEVEIRGKFFPAQVVKRPFYRSPHPAPR